MACANLRVFVFVCLCACALGLLCLFSSVIANVLVNVLSQTVLTIMSAVKIVVPIQCMSSVQLHLKLTHLDRDWGEWF